MAVKQGGGKSKRTSKKSAGERKSSNPIPLSPVQLVLLGKGPAIQAAKVMDRNIRDSDHRRKANRPGRAERTRSL